MQGHWAICLGMCGGTERQVGPMCSKNPHTASGPRLRTEASGGPVSRSAGKEVTKAPKTRLCRPFWPFSQTDIFSTRAGQIVQYLKLQWKLTKNRKHILYSVWYVSGVPDWQFSGRLTGASIEL